MARAYYSNSIKSFCQDSVDQILGILTRSHEFALEDLQRNAWLYQIELLQRVLSNRSHGHLLFEYTIPRMGKRVDAVLLLDAVVFAIEFKVGESNYPRHAIDQALDYALDLKNFHAESHERTICPILVATDASHTDDSIDRHDQGVTNVLMSNGGDLAELVTNVAAKFPGSPIYADAWENSIYRPTPTIIEAAQALYQGHSVAEISRSDAGHYNLSATSNAIQCRIEDAKQNHEKVICFVTGVPGAGKTLAGLNIANQRHNFEEGEHAVFLSGNGPLVSVLQEALARDEVERSRTTGDIVRKPDALQRTHAFIQNIHHFRDDMVRSDRPPVEHIAIFDEAQRAWTREKTAQFMKQKKGIPDFDASEPEFLIGAMDRHEDWAVVICLVGGGQEINDGEAGLPEWFSAIRRRFPHWKVFMSDQLTDTEYTAGSDIVSQIASDSLGFDSNLHLGVSVRSYRSEKVSEFVKSLLDLDVNHASSVLNEVKRSFPIAITRDLETAKCWVLDHARGTERFGLIASSGACRLRPHGIDVKNQVDPANWFLAGKDDVRSSFYMEEVGTEFDIQGLELDWTCIGWGADFRIVDGQWDYNQFRGSTWMKINKEVRKRYLKNAYRVLLTRARQGMVIFVPMGSDTDSTRAPAFYDQTFNFLVEIGLDAI